MTGPDRPRRPAVTAPSDAAPTATADASDSAVAVDPAPAAPDPVAVAKVSARLRRAHGQLAGVIRMLDDGRDCQDVVTQLAAVSRAIERAGFALVAANLRSCLRDPQGPDDVAAGRLEQLFLSLA